MEKQESTYSFCKDCQRLINLTLEKVIIPLREVKRKSGLSDILKLCLDDAENKCYAYIAQQICKIYDNVEDETEIEHMFMEYPHSQVAFQCLGIDEDTIEGLLRIRGIGIMDLTRMPEEETVNLLKHYLVPEEAQRHILSGLQKIQLNLDAIESQASFPDDSRNLRHFLNRLLGETSEPLPDNPPQGEQLKTDLSSHCDSKCKEEVSNEFHESSFPYPPSSPLLHKQTLIHSATNNSISLSSTSNATQGNHSTSVTSNLTPIHRHHHLTYNINPSQEMSSVSMPSTPAGLKSTDLRDSPVFQVTSTSTPDRTVRGGSAAPTVSAGANPSTPPPSQRNKVLLSNQQLQQAGGHECEYSTTTTPTNAATAPSSVLFNIHENHMNVLRKRSVTDIEAALSVNQQLSQKPFYRANGTPTFPTRFRHHSPARNCITSPTAQHHTISPWSTASPPLSKVSKPPPAPPPASAPQQNNRFHSPEDGSSLLSGGSGSNSLQVRGGIQTSFPSSTPIPTVNTVKISDSPPIHEDYLRPLSSSQHKLRKLRWLFNRTTHLCPVCQQKVKDYGSYQCDNCGMHVHKGCKAAFLSGPLKCNPSQLLKGSPTATRKDLNSQNTPNYNISTLPVNSSSPFLKSTNASDSTSASSCNSSTPGSPFVCENPIQSPRHPQSTAKVEFVFPAISENVNDKSPSSLTSVPSTNKNKLIQMSDNSSSLGSENTVVGRQTPRLISMDSQDEPHHLTRINSISVTLREWEIPLECVLSDNPKVIGQGNFGMVYLGHWHGDVAVKILDLEEDASEAMQWQNQSLLDSSDMEISNHSLPSPCSNQLARLNSLRSTVNAGGSAAFLSSLSSIEEWKRLRLEAFKREVATLHKTRHDNLVLFMGACMTPPILGIVMRYSTGVTLYHQLHVLKQNYPSNQCISIAVQIAKGMGYLHAKGILHKDLKSKNIFVEDNTRAVIGDFGLFDFVRLSRKQKFGDYVLIPKGWLCYLAPEIIRELDLHSIMADTSKDLPLTMFSDIYAFGTVWYELLTKEWPYCNHNAETIIYLVGKGIKQTLKLIPGPKDFKEIVNQCWNFVPTDRPPFPNLAKKLNDLPRLHRHPSYPVKSSVSKSHESLSPMP